MLLRRRAGGNGHAKPSKRLRAIHARQRTIWGVIQRHAQRKLAVHTPFRTAAEAAVGGAEDRQAKPLAELEMWMERAGLILTEARQGQELVLRCCTALNSSASPSAGRATPANSATKSAWPSRTTRCLMAGAHSFPDNPYDGHVFSAELK